MSATGDGPAADYRPGAPLLGLDLDHDRREPTPGGAFGLALGARPQPTAAEPLADGGQGHQVSSVCAQQDPSPAVVVVAVPGELGRQQPTPRLLRDQGGEAALLVSLREMPGRRQLRCLGFGTGHEGTKPGQHDSRFRSSLSTACLRALAELADVAGSPVGAPERTLMRHRGSRGRNLGVGEGRGAGRTLPAASVAFAVRVVTAPSGTVTVNPGAANSAAEPVASAVPVQSPLAVDADGRTGFRRPLDLRVGVVGGRGGIRIGDRRRRRDRATVATGGGETRGGRRPTTCTDPLDAWQLFVSLRSLTGSRRRRRRAAGRRRWGPRPARSTAPVPPRTILGFRRFTGRDPSTDVR